MKKILIILLDIKKELQNIKCILERPQFIPEDGDGKQYTNQLKISKPG